MKRISILGSGWLGLPLAVALDQLDYQIKASSRNTSRLNQIEQAGIAAHYFDIEKTDSDLGFLQADILIINITSKNVAAFQDLIKLIEKSPIKQVLFISSTSVYQDSNNLEQAAISEDDSSALKSCDLLSIENLFKQNKKFDSSIIRFSGLIGYQRHPGRFFLRTNDAGLSTCKPIKNPIASVNMIHRDDCLGIIEAIINIDCWGEIFNACSSHHPTRREFYKAALQNLAATKPLFVEGEAVIGKTIDNRKVKTTLGYSFKHDNLLDFESMPFTEH